MKTRVQLLDVLKGLLDKIYLFLTGRKHIQNEVRTRFALIQPSEIEINASPDDIEKYLMQEINRDFGIDPDAMDEALKKAILGKIIPQSQGMFLLPALHIRTILAKPTRRERRQALDVLPEDLYETFEQVMQRVQETKRYAKLGMNTMMWLHLAYRPLKVDELTHALAVQEGDAELDGENIPSQKALLDSCFGLAIIDEETSTVRFVHYSLEEYFRQYSSRYFPNGCSSVAGICLTYLNFGQVTPHCKTRDEIQQRIRNFPFLEYAGCNWGKYYAKQSTSTVKESVLRLLNWTHSEGTHSPCGLQVLYLSFPHTHWSYGLFDKDVASRFVGIHAAACFGLHDITKFLSEKWGADFRGDSEETALHLGAIHGHELIVKLLLARDDVDVNVQDRYGMAPLSLAAVNGHEAVVELLLARDDVDVNVKDRYGMTPLSFAVENGHETVLDLLLARDVDANVKDWDGRSPLSLAAMNGHEAVVELLLARDDVDVNVKDKDGWTPLSLAAAKGHEAVVELLLARDMDVNVKNEYDRTPLSLAAAGGHEAVVDLLLARDDVDVNIHDEDGRTALDWAYDGDHTGIIELLRSFGA